MRIKTFHLPVNLSSDELGYGFFAKVSIETYNFNNALIYFNFVHNNYFEGNLCAIFGALVEDLKSRNNIVAIVNCGDNVESLFKKNGFYSLINPQFKRIKNFDNTIDYQKFEIEEVDRFQIYIMDQLISHEGLPTISELLRKKINLSILEIFNNAHLHGQCMYVFTAGEFNYRSKGLKFTIADMGKTIRKNVNDYFNTGRKLEGYKCIDWAVKKGNTTRKGKIPGGLGFSLIRDFLGKNGGKIQIISSTGFWEESNGNIISRELKNRYLGTIVTFEFNMEDNNSYILSSELDPKNVL